MPTAPLRHCAEPGCYRKVARGRCPEHQRPRTRTSQRARGYDSRWDRLSKAVLRENPLCVKCEAVAALVDHIVPKRWGGPDDVMNCQPLCTGCHGEKSAAEGRIEKRGGTVVEKQRAIIEWVKKWRTL